jgi:hypothetical protein
MMILWQSCCQFWPKFGDNYRSYYIFKEELEAYVRDYAHGVSDRTLAQQIKQHCFSKAKKIQYDDWLMLLAYLLM